MRILAIDYGDKHTGLAIGEENSILELPAISTTSTNYLLSELKKVVDSENISLIVVGIPNNPDKSQKDKTQKFIEMLNSQFSFDIKGVDETGTSKESFGEMFTKHSDIKKIKKKIHSSSAAKILERYLMSSCK